MKLLDSENAQNTPDCDSRSESGAFCAFLTVLSQPAADLVLKNPYFDKIVKALKPWPWSDWNLKNATWRSASPRCLVSFFTSLRNPFRVNSDAVLAIWLRFPCATASVQHC